MNLIKTILLFLILCIGIFANEKENSYLSRAQLTLHTFFYSKDKSVMKAYTTLAEIRNAIKKDDSIKDKKKLLEVVDMNKDIITTHRNGLDKNIDRKEKAPVKIDYTVGKINTNKTEEIGTKKNKISGVGCRIIKSHISKGYIIVVTTHIKSGSIMSKGILEVNMYKKYYDKDPHRTVRVKLKNLIDHKELWIKVKVKRKYAKIEAVPIFVTWVPKN